MMGNGVRHLFRRKGSTEVGRVSRLAADGARGGVKVRCRLGWLDDIGRGRFGRRGRILAGLGQLLFQLTDVRAQLLILALEPRALGTGIGSGSCHDIHCRPRHSTGKVPVNAYARPSSGSPGATVTPSTRGAGGKALPRSTSRRAPTARRGSS